MRPIVTAGVTTGGLKGRRENCEKPIAGFRACGAAWRLVRGMEVLARIWGIQVLPKEEIMEVSRAERKGRM